MMDDFDPPPQGAIFVFGSNLAGRHGKGAALVARKQYGAVPGQGEGLMGQSYGIPTKGPERTRTLSVLPLGKIKWNVIRFLQFTHIRPGLTFFVTRSDCRRAG